MTPKGHDAPFIKKFQTPKGYYIYDVGTNHILKVDQVVHSIIDDVHRHSPAEILRKWRGRLQPAEVRRALAEIRRAIEREGLFLAERPKEIRPYNGEPIRRKLETLKCDHLILNVTENCNLRCGYCVYGGKYPNYRGHSTRRMPREIARKALDYFLRKSRGVRKPNIGFYGGEPLLNLDLIRYCVSYVKSASPKRHQFGLTTNGVLLTDRVSDYLIENEFDIMLSLDGPQEAHDRHRVDRKQKGTWDRVMRGVELLHAKSPRYFARRVSISTVVVSDKHLRPIEDFFKSHPLLSKVSVSASYPVYNPRPMAGEDAGAETASGADGPRRLYGEVEESLVQGRPLAPIVEGFFQRELLDIFRRRTSPRLGDAIPINGCCFPGERRLFVSCDGVFFACERVDGGHPLGDVHNGIEADKIERLVEEYRRACRDCLNCWAVRFCRTCFAGVCVGGKVHEHLRKEDCLAFREKMESVLRIYHTVIEKNRNAFEFLKKVKVS